MRQQRSSADKIAITRACKQNKEKEIPLPQEVPPSPTLLGNRRRCGFQRLLYYTLLEMRNSLIARYIPSELWHIFDLLIKCAYELENGITIDAIFDWAAYCISKVSIIHRSKIIRQNITQIVILSFIIIYLVYHPFLFKYYLFPP
jgi:hypothetical protein